jgi:hypothetical protein
METLEVGSVVECVVMGVSSKMLNEMYWWVLTNEDDPWQITVREPVGYVLVIGSLVNVKIESADPLCTVGRVVR